MQTFEARVCLGIVLWWCVCAGTAAGQPSAAEPIKGSAGQAGTRRSIAIGFAEPAYAPEVGLRSLPLKCVVVPADMRPQLERLWRDSATFRRQCARLVNESVPVVVRVVGPPRELGTAVARSRITIRDGRVTSVEIRLPAPSVVDLKYLAHEIEHVLEQLDGVDLQSAVIDGLHGVDRRGPGRFETVRAAAVEEQVARDLRMHSRR